MRDKWVSRAPVVSLSERDIPNISDPVIRGDLQAFRALHQEQKLPDVLRLFSEERKIYSVRYFPKDQMPVKINSVTNKAYMPFDYYRVDIWQIPVGKDKFKYEGVFISRPEAAFLDTDKPVINRKPHPAAKFIMSLCKNDIIELSKDGQRELCRIAGYATTGNKVDIRPIYASNTIAEWFINTCANLTSAFWSPECEGQNFKSINMLFNHYKVKLVKITIDGRSFYRTKY
jgi:CRISPR-associated endonuclease Csn1